MAPRTPHLENEKTLGALASRYVDIDALPWQATQFPGVATKVLLQDEDSGLMTALFKFDAGTTLPLHEHTAIEQTFILEGSLEDHEGNVTAGNYVWRPRGNRHIASSPDGALVLSFFLKPNHFLEDEQGISGISAL